MGFSLIQKLSFNLEAENYIIIGMKKRREIKRTVLFLIFSTMSFISLNSQVVSLETL
jgi:hypothetical protein